MQLTCSTTIDAPRQAIWDTITDWENAAERISAITAIEILEKPADGIVGFKWKETRKMFGKEATEVMWVTEAKAPEYYLVGAQSHGAIYESTYRIKGDRQPFQLEMIFSGTPQSFGAKVMSALLGWMIKGASRKALQKDLEEIKAYLEK